MVFWIDPKLNSQSTLTAHTDANTRTPPRRARLLRTHDHKEHTHDAREFTNRREPHDGARIDD
jgi:hypothetical protein